MQKHPTPKPPILSEEVLNKIRAACATETEERAKENCLSDVTYLYRRQAANANKAANEKAGGHTR